MPDRIVKPARESTDGRLSVEPYKTADELGSRMAVTDRVADSVLLKARGRAQEILRSTRKSADESPQRNELSAAMQVAIGEERARDGEVVRQEHARADAITAVERNERDRIVASLLDRERSDTDADLFQVVGYGVDVLFVGARGGKSTLYDREAVERRYGLVPAQLPSRTALVGDPSDNLLKVAGVGERTAEKLVRRFGDAPTLLARLDEVTPASLRNALAEASTQILQTERLARLRADLPLPAVTRFAAVGVDAPSRMRELFVAVEFKSLLARVARLADAAKPASRCSRRMRAQRIRPVLIQSADLAE